MDGRTTDWWRDGKKSPIDFHLIFTQQYLSIMILHTVVSQLTSGLSSLPREVKSSNMIWNPVNGSPKLYEFRTRGRWSGETQKIKRIGHSRRSLQRWAHWPKTPISLLSFFSYSLAPNEQISSLSPRMSFFIVQSQVIQPNTPLY